MATDYHIGQKSPGHLWGGMTFDALNFYIHDEFNSKDRTPSFLLHFFFPSAFHPHFSNILYPPTSLHSSLENQASSLSAAPAKPFSHPLNSALKSPPKVFN